MGRSDDEENVQEEDLGFGNILLVDNLPVVSIEKFEKLVSLIRGIYGRFGTIKEDWMPHDPSTNKTLGYCFIEYTTPQVFFESSVDRIINSYLIEYLMLL